MTWDWVDGEMLYEKIAELVDRNSNMLLSVPGAYEVFAEHFNNEALKELAEEDERCGNCGDELCEECAECHVCTGPCEIDKDENDEDSMGDLLIKLPVQYNPQKAFNNALLSFQRRQEEEMNIKDGDEIFIEDEDENEYEDEDDYHNYDNNS